MMLGHLDIITRPGFYLAAVPAVLITAISKGGFAGALGILAVPMLALAIPVPQAASIMLPILCLMDLFGWWNFRHAWDGRLLVRLLPPTLLGVVIGWLTYSRLDNQMIELLTGSLAFGFALLRLLGVEGGSRSLLPEQLRSGLWSTLSGYTSFLAHAGGPPIMIYLLPKKMDKTVLVATLTLYFAIMNYVKLVPYAFLGQLDLRNLSTALVLSPLVPLGVYLGLWLHRRVNERGFYQLCYLFLLVTGLRLIWEGAQRFFA